MAAGEYFYQDRAVAFIDVLGFREKLVEFEKSAILKKNQEQAEYLVSDKVNEFINTVKDVVELLDAKNYSYYLFSDNICITVDYIQNPELLFSLLFIINELFYSFAQKGYFLRGGIDLGKFVDEKQIALGIPLATAYLMESHDAVYPRILVSEAFNSKLNDTINGDSNKKYESILHNNLIHHNCEFHYLNVFSNVFRIADKVKFFKDFKIRIEENLILNVKKEKIHVKYAWLAIEYNKFLQLYCNELIQYQDEDPEEGLITELKTLNIN